MKQSEIDGLVYKFGGKYHGPNVEHISMPQSKFYEMIQEMLALNAQRLEKNNVVQ